MKSQTQRGVTLVITLVMLSVVTLMTLTFLAISRRERASVAVAGYQTTSKLMADSALARAQADIVARMLAHGTLLDYDHVVSTNLWSPYGFDTRQAGNLPNFTNVNYLFPQGNPNGALTEPERLRALGNLMFSPRAPVFIETNAQSRRPMDFRFYLDLNRNGRFETNGDLAVLDRFGQPFLVDNGQGMVVQSNRYVGDPEWIGELQRPDAPHSGTNRFIGRYAYLVLPTGKSLDLNFIHNNAARHTLGGLAYYRNQGVGSWELNLAAFLHDLNTNAWPGYLYAGLGGQPATESFQDAWSFLRYRYNDNYQNLFSVGQLFGAAGQRAFTTDFVDAYTDGPAQRGWRALTADNDRVTEPWPGSDNPRAYFELNDLFNTNRVPLTWMARLRTVQTGLSSYDRYTFYRMLGQLGTDSTPAARNKINLNYDNRPPLGATNLVSWRPVDFFMTVANRLLEVSKAPTTVTDSAGRSAPAYYIGDTLVRTNFGLTNIMLYPVNEYTPSVHRLLQLAVNLYDATTNRVQLSGYPYLPTVFKPTFRSDRTGVFIDGYHEITNTAFLNNRFVLRDLNNPLDRAALANEPDGVAYDVPFLIGAKKGFPNFNEFAMLNAAQISRRVEVVKRTPVDRIPFQTNLSYLVTVSNRFGIEFWNSYSNTFSRPLRLRMAGDVRMMLTNSQVFGGALWVGRYPYATNRIVTPWLGKQFLVPVLQSAVFLPEAVYDPLPRPHFVGGGTNAYFRRGLGFYVPQMDLIASNRFFAALIDETANRIVDFVAFGNLQTHMNLTRGLSGRAPTPSSVGVSAEPGNLWLTNRVQNLNTLLAPTLGVINQMEISLGNLSISDQQWRSYSRTGPGASDKPRAIDVFREFVGLTPLVYRTPRRRRQLRSELAGRVAVQAPYTPTRKVYQEVTWQVNDPLVHYLAGDLLDPRNRPNDPRRTNSVRIAVPPGIRLTNSNLGLLNNRFRPWGGNPQQSYDRLASDPGAKDPGVYGSDDWEFPANKFPNLGWIGRVHRGTPWQTVYLKSEVTDTNRWFLYAGSLGTHPTNDWRLVGQFTTALNDNASRGLLSVNQGGLAAWSAVLSGVSVLTNTTPSTGRRTNNAATFSELLIEAGSPQLQSIVAGLNQTRRREQSVGGYPIPAFRNLGRVLATPELTLRSPYLNTNNLMNDAIVERIPQQVLSLLKEDEPRFTVYAFGQALREATDSVYMGPGVFNRMCTNYQITGEFVSKSVIRIEGPPSRPRAVIEDYNEITSE